MAEYFDTVLFPRIVKTIYSPEWKDQQPKRLATVEEAERTPRLIKILRLESYEDALHNIASPSTQQRVATREKAYKTVVGDDEYRLRYLVKLPLKASETMLNISAMMHPFNYTIEALTDQGPTKKSVDLVETFNYLYGLRVQKYETWTNEKDKVLLDGERKKRSREYRVITATDRMQKRRVLVVWRDMTTLDPIVERDFLEDKLKSIVGGGKSFDEMLINGDSAVAGFASLDPLFKRMMMVEGEDII